MLQGKPQDLFQWYCWHKSSLMDQAQERGVDIVCPDTANPALPGLNLPISSPSHFVLPLPLSILSLPPLALPLPLHWTCQVWWVSQRPLVPTERLCSFPTHLSLALSQSSLQHFKDHAHQQNIRLGHQKKIIVLPNDKTAFSVFTKYPDMIAFLSTGHALRQQSLAHIPGLLLGKPT